MLELKQITKTYGKNKSAFEAIKDLTFSVKEQEFVSIVGPSGCGKTTLLKIMSGLMQATSGEIILDGKSVSGPGKDRGLVFQQFTLFPWLTVRDNISFGLDLQKMDRKKKGTLVNHYLEITGLADFASSYPKNLSGGQQQRVAIARMLANDPKVLLMDEPFGALDSQTRSAMQEFLVNLWEAEHKTIIFITHDVGEAVFLSDTVHVLSKSPTVIKKSFTIPFSRPRTHDLKFTKEFFDLEREISAELEN